MVFDALNPKSRKKAAAKNADHAPAVESTKSNAGAAETSSSSGAAAAAAAAAASSASASASTPQDPAQASIIESAPAAPASVAGGEWAGRMKGPVEEILAKRARQYAKKIQRFKGYAASTTPLNADQKAAVATLPALESVYNELQELTKSGGLVEVAELNEAARIRDLQKNQNTAGSSTSGSVSPSALASPLGQFLRLHGLLHPARPSDHENLTFGRLRLPASLEDEVNATDILRVGRMYEDLTSGGEAGAAVLETLARGPSGSEADHEEDHIFHLMHILTESKSEQLDNNREEDGAAITEAPRAEAAPSFLAPQDETAAAATAGPAHNGSGQFNFLQQDEVNELDQPKSESQRELEADQSYEIIPPMEAHQTSGQQPPLQSAPATSSAPAPTAAAEDFDWADDEDHHTATGVPAAEQLQGHAGDISLAQPIETNATAEPVTTTQILEPFHDHQATDNELVDAEAGESHTVAPEEVSHGAAEHADAPTTGAQPTATAIMSGQVSAPQVAAGNASGSREKKPRQPQQQQQAQPKNLPRTLVDEDGFEMKVRNRAPSQQQQGAGAGRGGRGGRGGAAAGANGERGGRGGRGAPGGMNRGPSNRGPRPAQGANGSTESQAAQGTDRTPRPPRTGTPGGQRSGRGRGGAQQGQGQGQAGGRQAPVDGQAAAAAAAAAAATATANA